MRWLPSENDFGKNLNLNQTLHLLTVLKLLGPGFWFSQQTNWHFHWQLYLLQTANKDLKGQEVWKALTLQIVALLLCLF